MPGRRRCRGILQAFDFVPRIRRRHRRRVGTTQLFFVRADKVMRAGPAFSRGKAADGGDQNQGDRSRDWILYNVFSLRGPSQFNALRISPRTSVLRNRSSSAIDACQADTWTSQRAPFETSEMMLVSISSSSDVTSRGRTAIDVDAVERRRGKQRLQTDFKGLTETLLQKPSRLGLARRIGQGGRNTADQTGIIFANHHLRQRSLPAARNLGTPCVHGASPERILPGISAGPLQHL
jgi:hypothetical protein